MIVPGTIVSGRYRIARKLGGGGMKVVYAANDLRLAGRICALAEMVDAFADSDAQAAATQAFRREAEILAELAHQHIPSIFDCFSEANHHYLVMEFVDGMTLQEELVSSAGMLPVERVVEIALQILEALRYLHGRKPPIIHRDLKPSNVMTTKEGSLKLIDFGIARHFAPLARVTTIGTHGYAPPEQYAGRAEPRSDLYALAAIMHQALSGRDPALEAPFRFPPLRRFCPDLNARLIAVIERALAYDAINRPHDAKEFRQLLLEAEAHPSRPASSGFSPRLPSNIPTATAIDTAHESTDQWTGARYSRERRGRPRRPGVK